MANILCWACASPRSIFAFNCWAASQRRLSVAAFLTTVGVESARLVFTKEIWGPTLAQTAYEPPSKKASELGNTQPGDGLRFCGRGLIQITGRRNYTLAAVGFDLDLLNHPELLEQPANAAMSAAWYWFNRKLNTLADMGDFRRARNCSTR